MGDGTYRVTVDAAGVTWGPDAKGVEGTEATVVAGWYDAKGKLLGHIAREEVSPRGDAAVFSLPIVVPAGTKRLRVVVRDASSGRMGTVDVTTF